MNKHKRGERITYTTAEGTHGSGVIVWVQAATDAIGVKYVVAPDEPTGFVDFVLPGDVIMREEDTQDQALTKCPSILWPAPPGQPD
jgi:hypothetical protein